MKSSKKPNIIQFLVFASVAVATAACDRFTESETLNAALETSAVESDSPAVASEPFIALWWAFKGLETEATPPCLRFAIWEDGRMVFAPNPQTWGKDLLEGQLSMQQMTDVKQRIQDSGVTSLTRRSYLVPDSPAYYITAVVNGKKHLLEWDEVETSNYGIMTALGQNERGFVKCWQMLNRVGVTTRPTASSPSNFQ